MTPPVFEQTLVEGNLSDGYWVAAVDLTGNGLPDLVAHGLAEGNVVWYENQNPGWQKHPILTLPKPVASDYADVDGDGKPDIVICHDYGTCMYNCKPEDGKVSWLRNPGASNGTGSWERQHIGDLVASHRLRFGHFTQTKNLELLVAPVVGPNGGPEALHQPIRVTLYPRADNVLNAPDWSGTVVDDSSFRIIHDVLVGKFGAKSGSDLDSVLLATEEGIIWLYYGPDGAWHHDRLGIGEQGEVGQTGFKGTGNLAVGKLGGDPFAYIATIEPFHGNVVAVYSKDATSDLTNVTWRRTVLDVYADPNQAGEGPGHSVVAADFDGDGDDEFLVALRGPMPWQGVFYYKAVDAANGLWVKTRVSSASAARIAVADFDDDGRLDFATTGYYTPGYFLCEDPRVLVFYNRFADVPAR